MLTIHNLAFQGQFDPAELSWIGLGRDLLHPRPAGVLGARELAQGGVVFSDMITTVSPTYAREIVTPEYGFGFDGILASRAADLVGIVNGIDTETWDPTTDPHLPAHFDARRLEGKAGVEARAARVRRPAERRGGHAASDDRHRDAAHAPEGLRPGRGRGGSTDGIRRDLGDARQRRSVVRRPVAAARGALPRARGRPDRLRRAARRT